MSVYQKLANVQRVLKCNKSKYNSFGKYKYRSCEDILEAAKPLCIEQGLLLLVSDSIQLIGERYYVMATATIVDLESGEKVENTAYAREEDSKKGCDLAQLTGVTSSYARKYCLNGLFCLDDTQDSDTEEHARECEGRDKANKKADQEAKYVSKDENGKTCVLASDGQYYTLESLNLKALNTLSNDARFKAAHKEIFELMAKAKK